MTGECASTIEPFRFGPPISDADIQRYRITPTLHPDIARDSFIKYLATEVPDDGVRLSLWDIYSGMTKMRSMSPGQRQVLYQAGPDAWQQPDFVAGLRALRLVFGAATDGEPEAHCIRHDPDLPGAAGTRVYVGKYDISGRQGSRYMWYALMEHDTVIDPDLRTVRKLEATALPASRQDRAYDLLRIANTLTVDESMFVRGILRLNNATADEEDGVLASIDRRSVRRTEDVERQLHRIRVLMQLDTKPLNRWRRLWRTLGVSAAAHSTPQA